MAGVGINSNVQAGNRVFHIQTATIKTNSVVRSEIYEKGRLLTFFEKKIESPGKDHLISPEELQNIANDFHKDRVYELEMLFDMSANVRTIKHSLSNNKMGVVFLRLNLVEDAVEEFKLAIAHNPKFIEAYTNLGKAYIEMSEHYKAIAMLNQALRINSKYPDIYNILGLAYFMIGNFVESLTAINKSLEINPNFYDALINKAQTLIGIIKALEAETDAFLTAKEELKKTVNQLQTLLINSEYPNLARIPMQVIANQFDLAQTDLRELKQYMKYKNSIVDVTDIFYLKFMFGGEGRNDAIISHYEKMIQERIEHNPHFADLHNTIGILHLIQCRNIFLKAIDDFKKALTINPEYEMAKKNLKLSENDGKGFLILLRAILK
jgi:tetratricopeptide (TPR) repeat protein